MSIIIELSDDELRGLTSLMSKLHIPFTFPVIPVKKLTKIEEMDLRRDEYIANKKRKK